MSLTLTIGRDSLKICHKEGARTTVWDVSKNDSEESIVQTFKDVIAFVEGDQAPVAPPSGPYREPKYPALEALPPTNGWTAAFQAPALPDRLKGEVELIQPGEDA